MSFVQAHTVCDICGKDMLDPFETKYAILPRKLFLIRTYICHDAVDKMWSSELDICESCWEKMKDYIKNGKS